MNAEAVSVPIADGRHPEGSDCAAASVSVSGSAVALNRLTKKFGDFVAVDEVSLDVKAGEFVSLLGPSGSGKTTILMMVAGFESPTSGTVHIAERNITDAPPYKRDIGMVFQSYALFPHMTVFENIAYPLKLRKAGRADIARRVQWALDIMRLPAEQYANRYPNQLSGGQRQRVALVRALVYEPRVLLMDEPMGALDKNLRDELKLELIALRNRLRLTILYVTHDQSEALMLSDRVAVMRDGRIEQIDPPELLYKRPKTEFVASFLGEANLLPVKRRSAQVLDFGHGIERKVPGGSLPDNEDRWVFMVRPEEIDLVNCDQATVSGRIARTVFLGSSIRAEVETPVGTITVIANSASSRKLQPGDQIGLQFDTDDPVLIPPSS